eukprot:COSAG06_NODE_856_length_11920_cov_2.789358_2_plen_176_part_00
MAYKRGKSPGGASSSSALSTPRSPAFEEYRQQVDTLTIQIRSQLSQVSRVATLSVCTCRKRGWETSWQQPRQTTASHASPFSMQQQLCLAPHCAASGSRHGGGCCLLCVDRASGAEGAGPLAASALGQREPRQQQRWWWQWQWQWGWWHRQVTRRQFIDNEAVPKPQLLLLLLLP